MGRSVQPHAYSSDGPQGTAPKGLGDRPQDAPSAALLPRAASTPASLPSLGTLALLPWSTLVPLPLRRCSQISPPKSLSRLTGYKLFLPFSCCTSRSGHPSAAAASHAAELTLRGWAEGRGWFWERSIVRCHARGLIAHEGQGMQHKRGLHERRSRRAPLHCETQSSPGKGREARHRAVTLLGDTH